jgi:hypothetical protein
MARTHDCGSNGSKELMAQKSLWLKRASYSRYVIGAFDVKSLLLGFGATCKEYYLSKA